MTEKIDRYEIVRELGRGGMATVYLAQDPRFDRLVALKVLPRQFLHDTTFLERFNREARTIARLEHTAIVPVYDFGEYEGQPFLVMRYMSGGSLSDRLQTGALPMKQVADILRRLGDALDYSHSRGVVHRDLKPGNILFDDRDNAFLSDFGIAKLAEATANLTGTAIIGTPAYMSPEQAQGNQTLDGRSDVYALGIILFQMLTGKLPFEANTPAKQLVAHILSPVPMLSLYRRDLPPTCDGLITKAMAKNRDERFSTASQMAQALEEVTRGRGVSEEPGSEGVGDMGTAVPEKPTPPLPVEEPPVAEPSTPAVSEAASPVVDLGPTEVMHELDTPPAFGGEETIVDTGEIPGRLQSMPTPRPQEVVEEPAAAEDELYIIEPEPEPVTDINSLASASGVTPQAWSQQAADQPRKLPAWVWGVAALAVVVLLVGGFLLLRGGNEDEPVIPAANPQEPLPPGTKLVEFIERQWGAGYDATSLVYGDRLWAVMMSQGEGGGQQTWHVNPDFPGDFIQDRWQHGFDVAEMAYGDGRWVVIMSRGEGAGFQTWHTAPDFPSEFIQTKWAEGFDVTSLAYGDRRWAVVMSRGVGAGFQTWHIAPDFPKEFIQTKWEEGFDVTSLTYGDGRWAVVMSRGEGAGFQTWHTAPDFPKEFIQTKWEEGFDVTSLTYGDGRWAVIMSRDSGDSRQTWQTAQQFN
ncbi:MAG: serine/threonine protein kinase [Ardenticatenaceae bacterium]|nr:serine/threonine protein kinase [Anaerolineales bacterium]MCB8923908.1 serine/threonine protein kinase [Ardenticatenaceae bacterium]MCB8990447.1 serine/threonine protein kinase [Ardenticatenaceae bacterium]MCB9003461.1 serine/threonine protein kinase [Ardenticatenaceae bacterium]